MDWTRASRPSVLFIDDDPDQLNVLGTLLERNGYSVTRMPCAERALAALEKQEFDVVVCDLKMPNMSGEEFLERFRSDFGRKTPVVILSAAFEVLDEIYHELGNTRFCRKENCGRTLVRHVECALE